MHPRTKGMAAREPTHSHVTKDEGSASYRRVCGKPTQLHMFLLRRVERGEAVGIRVDADLAIKIIDKLGSTAFLRRKRDGGGEMMIGSSIMVEKVWRSDRFRNERPLYYNQVRLIGWP